MPTLAEAIFQKFADVNSDVDTNGKIVIIAPKIDTETNIPSVLVISSSNVDKTGDPEELSKVLSSVVELDISRNNINDLNEVGVIFHHAPKLQFLNAGFNPLSTTTLPEVPSQFPSADALSTLILIGTCATWEIVWFLLRRAKNVTELHLSLNQYTEIRLPNPQEPKLDTSFNVSKLMFDGNPVSLWEEVAKLGIVFPHLNLLSLTDCPVSEIPENGGETFKSLKTLWLSNCHISKIEDLENLKHFAALNDLRLNGIPLFENFKEEARRQHFIALLPNIVILNRGRKIFEGDRITAERNFIRHYLDSPNPPARYHELKQIHGDVHKLVEVNFKPPTKVNLLIYYADKELCRLDVSLKKTVTELKDLLEPTVGLEAQRMILFYLDPTDSYGGKECMKYPNKQLYTYHMKDGDEIYVYQRGTVVCGSTAIRHY